MTSLIPARPPVRPVSGAAAAEWIKLRTLPSAMWLLAGAVVAVVAVGVFPALGVAVGALPPEAGDATGGVLGGLDLAGLLAGALGAVAVTSEYASRTIISTLAAVPRRLTVLAAKAAVVAAVVAVAGVVAVLVALLGAAALLSAGGAPVPVVGPTLARLVVGAGLQLAVTALLGVALGFLLRRTAGAVAALVAFPVVASLLGLLVPAAGPYLPGSAAAAVVAVEPLPGMLAPAAGLAVYATYAAIGLVAAAVALVRRDA
jgi:ABC-type transport system involved in multi-copper enzyme maturation permease subunit